MSTPSVPGTLPGNATLTVGSYASIIIVAVASAWLCDMFISFPEEIYTIKKGPKCSFPVIAYIFARVTAFGYLSCATVMAVGQVNCAILTRATDWFAALCLPATSLLFFLRIRGVFYNNRPVIVFFAILWCSTLGILTQPFTIHRESDHKSSLCLTDVTSFSTVGLIAVAVFDTVVFLAISIRLGVTSYVGNDNWKEHIKAFFAGDKTLLHGNILSRRVLKTGQLYYLASIGVTLASTVVLLVPSIPTIVKCCITVPSAAMQNAMACRVFRMIRRVPSEEDDYDISHDTNNLPRSKSRSSSLVFADPSDIKLTSPLMCHIMNTRKETQLARTV